MNVTAKYRHISATAKNLWPQVPVIIFMCFLFSVAIHFRQAEAADGRDELLRSVAKLSALLQSGLALHDLQTIQVEIITNSKLATIAKVTIPDEVRILIVTMEKVRSVWEMTLASPCNYEYIAVNSRYWTSCIERISNSLSSIGVSAPSSWKDDVLKDIVRNCLAALGQKADQAVTALSN